jgi:hypothetical protein
MIFSQGTVGYFMLLLKLRDRQKLIDESSTITAILRSDEIPS